MAAPKARRIEELEASLARVSDLNSKRLDEISSLRSQLALMKEELEAYRYAAAAIKRLFDGVKPLKLENEYGEEF